MIIIDIDIPATKTETIIFEIKIAYVSNLAHLWCGGYISLQGSSPDFFLASTYLSLL
jgi:hypothetical protein